MRPQAFLVVFVSAFSLADVLFGFQETDTPTGKSATPAETQRDDGDAMPVEVRSRGSIGYVSVCDVRCELSPTGKKGVAIRKLVPEGSLVEKGQVLVEFDARRPEDRRRRQQITCNLGEAAVIKSSNDYEAAVIGKVAYLEGYYTIEKLQLDGTVFVAAETLRRARKELEVITKAAESGQGPTDNREAAEFSVENATKELELAKTRTVVLDKYTKVTTLKHLESQIKTAEAQLKAEEEKYRVSLDRLERIASQIEKCTVKSPQAGRVIYAAPQPATPESAANRSESESEPAIQEGARVRHGQPILLITDPHTMQVTVLVPEPAASQFKPGASATIRVDAFPDTVLRGTVENIAPSRSNGSSASQQGSGCQITVSIQNPPEKLRTGMTAEVRIQATSGVAVLDGGQDSSNVGHGRGSQKSDAAQD